MQTAASVVDRDPDTCWRAFVDATTFSAWIPGLRRARVIRTDESGLPIEIHFEHGASRTYTLVYCYDVANREVRWEPRANRRDAVAGFARFEAEEGGTRVTYGLANETGRTELAELDALLAAFGAWICTRPRTAVR